MAECTSQVVSHSWIYPSNYTVREYQRNIVETCLKENTLVSLPTGLGKTLIAAVVMFNYYRWFPHGKIVFMAPTRPLVSQQIAACRDIMCIPDEDVAHLEGSVSVAARETLWREKRVFFCTPQVVDNDVYSGSCPSADIVCIIVDEAHRASSSNYAYAKVVRALGRQAVRVIGLSATPGADRNSVQNVIRNLRISRVEYRSENSADLAEYTHEKDVDIVKCRPSSSEDEPCMLSSSRLKRCLDDLLQLMGSVLQQNDLLVSSNPNHISAFVLDEADRACGDESIPVTNRVDARNAVKLAKFLVAGRGLLAGAGSAKLLAHMRASQPASNMEQLMRRHPSYADMLQLLGTMDHSVASRHVRRGGTAGFGSTGSAQACKTTMLKKILLEHFGGQKDSRAIVFVNLRSTVQELVIELSHCAGLRVNQFVGQGISKSSVAESSLGGQGTGQCQSEQQAVVRAFNRGDYNVLVATSIAEEGLDIAEVDLVVSYDVVTSPVRMLQVRISSPHT